MDIVNGCIFHTKLTSTFGYVSSFAYPGAFQGLSGTATIYNGDILKIRAGNAVSLTGIDAADVKFHLLGSMSTTNSVARSSSASGPVYFVLDSAGIASTYSFSYIGSEGEVPSIPGGATLAATITSNKVLIATGTSFGAKASVGGGTNVSGVSSSNSSATRIYVSKLHIILVTRTNCYDDIDKFFICDYTINKRWKEAILKTKALCLRWMHPKQRSIASISSLHVFGYILISFVSAATFAITMRISMYFLWKYMLSSVTIFAINFGEMFDCIPLHMVAIVEDPSIYKIIISFIYLALQIISGLYNLIKLLISNCDLLNWYISFSPPLFIEEFLNFKQIELLIKLFKFLRCLYSKVDKIIFKIYILKFINMLLFIFYLDIE